MFLRDGTFVWFWCQVNCSRLCTQLITDGAGSHVNTGRQSGSKVHALNQRFSKCGPRGGQSCLRALFTVLTCGKAVVGTTPGASSRSRIQTVAPKYNTSGVLYPHALSKGNRTESCLWTQSRKYFCVTDWEVCIKHFYCVQKCDWKKHSGSCLSYRNVLTLKTSENPLL